MYRIVSLIAGAVLAAAVLPWGGGAEPVRLAPVAARPHIGLGPSPQSWPGSDDDPRAQLDFTRRDDLAALSLTGQFAAELAALSADPATVLAEHQRIRREIAGDEHPVVLLRSTDLAHPATDRGVWLTLALGDFPDRPSVTGWCRTISVPHCVPRRLDPPR
ncbi:hypothetical protein [Actinoplanes ianthinogenes]|nr:hypothetical protein [Actinoplanes ianthinogenes]